jgi:hypothetical protein
LEDRLTPHPSKLPKDGAPGNYARNLFRGRGSLPLARFPITAVEVARGRELSVAVSLILPFVSLLVTYVVVARRWEKKAPSLPLWMCFGIYVLGPVMMEIGYSALQGGLTRFSGWQDVKFLAFLSVPPLALMFAGVVAIPMVLSTAVLLWAHFKARKRNVSALDAPGTGADLP